MVSESHLAPSTYMPEMYAPSAGGDVSSPCNSTEKLVDPCQWLSIGQAAHPGDSNKTLACSAGVPPSHDM